MGRRRRSAGRCWPPSSPTMAPWPWQPLSGVADNKLPQHQGLALKPLSAAGVIKSRRGHPAVARAPPCKGLRYKGARRGAELYAGGRRQSLSFRRICPDGEQSSRPKRRWLAAESDAAPRQSQGVGVSLLRRDDLAVSQNACEGRDGRTDATFRALSGCCAAFPDAGLTTSTATRAVLAGNLHSRSGRSRSAAPG